MTNNAEQPIRDGEVKRVRTDPNRWKDAEFKPAPPMYSDTVSAGYKGPSKLGATFAKNDLFEVTDREGNFPETEIRIVTLGSSWNYGVSAEKPWPEVGQNSSATVNIYGYGPRVKATDHGARKHPADGEFAVNKKIESEPVHHAVRDAILRAMNDGNVSTNEAKKLESLRVMVTKYGLNDGKFDDKETQEIVNLAKTIAPSAEAKARYLQER